MIFMFRIPEQASLELMNSATYLLAHFAGIETAVRPIIAPASSESSYSFSDSLIVGTSTSCRTPTSPRLEAVRAELTHVFSCVPAFLCSTHFISILLSQLPAIQISSSSMRHKDNSFTETLWPTPTLCKVKFLSQISYIYIIHIYTGMYIYYMYI